MKKAQTDYPLTFFLNSSNRYIFATWSLQPLASVSDNLASNWKVALIGMSATAGLIAVIRLYLKWEPFITNL